MYQENAKTSFSDLHFGSDINSPSWPKSEVLGSFYKNERPIRELAEQDFETVVENIAIYVIEELKRESSPVYDYGFDLHHQVGDNSKTTVRFIFAKSAEEVLHPLHVRELAELRLQMHHRRNWIGDSLKYVADVMDANQKEAVAYVHVKLESEDHLFPVRSGDYVVDRKTGQYYHRATPPRPDLVLPKLHEGP
jgi:hypothetical protein